MGELYRISFPNGKGYIGITAKTAQHRFAAHLYEARRGATTPVHRAIRKYGADSIILETIGLANDWAALCALERCAIASQGTRSPAGYNATDGGDGAPMGHSYRVGLKHSAEAKAKMATSKLGRSNHTAESRAAIGAASKGNKHALGTVKSQAARTKLARSLLTTSKSSSASGFRGVSFCKTTGRWRAHIFLGGKMRTLGRFDDLLQAAAVRAEAVRVAVAAAA